MRFVERSQWTPSMLDVGLVDVGIVTFSIGISPDCVQAMQSMLTVNLCKVCVATKSCCLS